MRVPGIIVTWTGPSLPDHPVLAQVARSVEEMGRVAEIVDREWRLVYVSAELHAVVGSEEGAEAVYGLSMIQRQEQFPDSGTDAESSRRWWFVNAPYMRWTLEADAPQFGANTAAAARVTPTEPPPVWGTWTRFTRAQLAYSPDQYLLHIRLNEPDGTFAGVLVVSWPRLPGAVTGQLSRGDVAMYERMARMTEPHRCETAILFADLERSGEHSRQLSSRAYFELIREITTAFDHATIANDGIVGRHAGDGASAFFCPPDFGGSASGAAAAAIRAARQTQAVVATLDVGIAAAINVGVHWGATVMMGQVVTGGRLEVTALGDEVTEAARIQDAARGGSLLASKNVIERLDPDDAHSLGIDLAAVSYRLLGSFEHLSDKARRDASNISITDLSSV